MDQTPDLQNLVIAHRDETVVRDLLKIKESRKHHKWWMKLLPPKVKTKPVSWS